ncbi:MAG: WxcM-like domain-containing protein [Halobacteriota archaeon]
MSSCHLFKPISALRLYYGLYVPTLVWQEVDSFSSGSVCLVLASDFLMNGST